MTLAELPCPCCGKPTSKLAVLRNEQLSRQAAVVEARERLARIPVHQVERVEVAQRQLYEARARLAEMEAT